MEGSERWVGERVEPTELHLLQVKGALKPLGVHCHAPLFVWPVKDLSALAPADFP